MRCHFIRNFKFRHHHYHVYYTRIFGVVQKKRSPKRRKECDRTYLYFDLHVDFIIYKNAVTVITICTYTLCSCIHHPIHRNLPPIPICAICHFTKPCHNKEKVLESPMRPYCFYRECVHIIMCDKMMM